MYFLSKSPLYVGIETTTTSLRIVLIQQIKSAWQLLSVKELSFSEGEQFLSHLTKNAIITSLFPQRQVMVRTLSMDLKREKDVCKALDFQIEPHLPFSLEEAILQTQIKKQKTKEGFSVTVFALKEAALKDYLEKQTLKSDAVISSAIALAALSSLDKKHEGEEAKYLINIGEQETTIVLAKQGQVLDQRSFLTEKNTPLAIHRALLSLESMHPQYAESIVLLFGKESSLQVKKLQEQTGRKIHVMNPLLENLSQEELATFALALGAALSQSLPKAINFRPNNLGGNYTYKLIKKPLALALTLTLICFSILISGGIHYLKTKQECAQHKMTTLLHFCGEEHRPLKKLQQYDHLLSFLEKKFSYEEQGYVLEPHLPRVSEVLRWLSEEISRAPPPLEGLIINEFNYELVHRPTPLVKNEQYQVQVEVLFSAISPNVKETFEELLERSDSIIDTEEAIQVSFGAGKGRALFTLRDQTRYG